MKLRTIDVRGRELDYRTVIPRAEFDVEHAVSVVQPICDGVRDRGSEALAEYAERFDRVVPPSFRVPADVLAPWLQTPIAGGDGTVGAVRAAASGTP